VQAVAARERARICRHVARVVREVAAPERPALSAASNVVHVREHAVLVQNEHAEAVGDVEHLGRGRIVRSAQRIPADGPQLLQAQQVDARRDGRADAAPRRVLAEAAHLDGLPVQRHARVAGPRDAAHADNVVARVDGDAVDGELRAKRVEVRPGHGPELGGRDGERAGQRSDGPAAGGHVCTCVCDGDDRAQRIADRPRNGRDAIGGKQNVRGRREARRVGPDARRGRVARVDGAVDIGGRRDGGVCEPAGERADVERDAAAHEAAPLLPPPRAPHIVGPCDEHIVRAAGAKGEVEARGVKGERDWKVAGVGPRRESDAI